MTLEICNDFGFWFYAILQSGERNMRAISPFSPFFMFALIIFHSFISTHGFDWGMCAYVMGFFFFARKLGSRQTNKTSIKSPRTADIYILSQIQVRLRTLSYIIIKPDIRLIYFDICLFRLCCDSPLKYYNTFHCYILAYMKCLFVSAFFWPRRERTHILTHIK